MNDAALTTYAWPPECCVPAFLSGALAAKHFSAPEPRALPRLLGVRVRADQYNPLRLSIADHCNPPGLRAIDAEREINRLFHEYSIPLACRRVPFLEISFGLWEDVLDAALAKSVVVGVGVDFGVLARRTTQSSAWHVLRVLSRDGDELKVVDDSGEAIPVLSTISMDRTFKAVMAIPDGFWMIGAAADLDLPLTSPWKAI